MRNHIATCYAYFRKRLKHMTQCHSFKNGAGSESSSGLFVATFVLTERAV